MKPIITKRDAEPLGMGRGLCPIYTTTTNKKGLSSSKTTGKMQDWQGFLNPYWPWRETPG